jgi:hypothetical protein
MGICGEFLLLDIRTPNPIGFTVVELLERKENILKVKGVDMVDGTPVVDIKPHTSADKKKNIRLGWIEKTRSGNPHKVKTLIVYWSGTGNTEKVAKAIHRGLKREGLKPTIKMVEEAREEDLYDYDLVFLGSPSHTWMPAQPVLEFIREKRREYAKRGLIKPCAPKIPEKNAVVFCTYSGPHTGINEAIPAGKYMRQFFEHIGFDVRAEWYVVGEFHGNELLSTKGKLGDIRGRPNSQDLAKVENDTVQLIRSLM